MLRYVSFDIVFQEIPHEVSLAINISGCPNRCGGCHSPWLWEQVGDPLDEPSLETMLDRYGSSVTSVCFMGGDADPKSIDRLAAFIKQRYERLKTAWYSGRDHLPENIALDNFNFIKLGRYNETLGGLKSPNTNQRFYSVEKGRVIDQTNLFQKA